MTVQLGADPEHWRLTVTDDGVGFDHAHVVAAGMGAGLANMRDRLDAVGGTVTIGFQPGNGTTVDALVPNAEDPDPLRTHIPIPRQVG